MSLKRNLFEKHLAQNGCSLHRHGSKHDVFVNNLTGKKTTVPRHPQLDKQLCKLICKQLEIPSV